MQYSIRDLNKEDLPQLLILIKEHAEYEKAFFSEEGKKERLEEAIFSVSPSLFCKVVVVDSKLSGYFTYTFDFSTWSAQAFLYLDCLYLAEKIRGNRIGEEILKILRTIAIKNACANIQWQTPSFNEAAIRFYLRNGAMAKEKIRFTL